ncbi:DUF3883 domain-containing protein [Haloferula helveola]
MLNDELAGRPINKTAVRRELLPRLDNRSNGALEFKNCNISAALLTLGLPPLDGYKPRWNYQKDLLHAVISEVLRAQPDLFKTVELAVNEQIEKPEVSDLLAMLDPECPERSEIYHGVQEGNRQPCAPIKRNYLELETRNRSIGLAGESLVVEFERSRLISLNREHLADRIEHVSEEQGDGTGYDIRSFDESGRDLFIEVKTTRFRKESPFFISSNEVQFAERHARNYSLYRVYSLSRAPRLFTLPGSVQKSCHLTATQFRATL